MVMMGANSSKFAWLLRADVIGCLLCIVVFVQFPTLDIVVSSWFFRDGHFFLANNGVVQMIYWTFAKIHYVLLLGFAGVFVRYFWADKKNELRNCRLKQLKIMTIALVFVPGILVNTIIKDNSLGRARPHQIEQFSGEKHFSSAFAYSGECRRNCSFVSGHAAIGFYFMLFGWVFGRRRWWQLGVLLGTTVGLVRIIQGGHFLSDVVFSFWACYWPFLWLVKGNGYSLGVPTFQPTGLLRTQ